MLAQEVALAFGYAPFCLSKKGDVEGQLRGLKIFKAIGYIPVLGFGAHIVFLSAFSCANIDLTKKEWTFLTGRTLLALSPPLLAIADLVVTIAQNRLIKKNQLIQFNQHQTKRLSYYDSFLHAHSSKIQSSLAPPPLNPTPSSGHLLKQALIQKDRKQTSLLLKHLTSQQLRRCLQHMNDFRIIFGENILCTHRILLKDCLGSYFAGMMKSKMKEVTAREIHLPEKEYHCFVRAYETQLLNIDLPLTRQNYQDYLVLSHKYDLPTVKDACEQWILKHISYFDAKKLFTLARYYHLERIKQRLIEQVFYKYVGKTQQPIKKLSVFEKKRLRDWLATVKHLNLRFLITRNDAKEMITLLKQCRSLETLTLWVNDGGLLEVLHHLPKLKSLNLILERETSLEAFKQIKGLPINILDIRKMQLCPSKRAIIASLPFQLIHFA